MSHAMNGSWMSLLTSLTLGAGASAVRAQLHAAHVHPAKQLRLVVQTYDPREGRVLGAIQRAVTPKELEQGLAIDVPHMAAGEEPYVVAWVEHGEPNLEHDGLDARPQEDSL